VSGKAVESSNFRKDSSGIYRCIPFEAFDWIEHGFSTRHASEFLASHPAMTLRQVHSAEVWNAHGLTDRCHQGDALISNELAKRIGVRTADCVPILMADERSRSVAAVHAGWRGTAAKIVLHTVERLRSEFGANPADLRVAIGPCIQKCCYEVGNDVARQFHAFFPEWLSGTETLSHQQIDLAESNRRIPLSGGVLAAHIYDSGLCTFCQAPDFFSYRREPEDPGRLLSFIARVK
jgi:YfiH family protein